MKSSFWNMYVNFSEEKKTPNITDNKKKYAFYMYHFSLVHVFKKNIPSRNSVKTKVNLFIYSFNIFFFSIIW